MARLTPRSRRSAAIERPSSRLDQPRASAAATTSSSSAAAPPASSARWGPRASARAWRWSSARCSAATACITGCVPSKAIVRSARAAADARRAGCGRRARRRCRDGLRRGDAPDARTPRRHQPARLGVAPPFGRRRRLFRRGALHVTVDDRRSAAGRCRSAARDRHRRPSGRAADPGPVQRALPDERDAVLADRAAAPARRLSAPVRSAARWRRRSRGSAAS